MTDLSKPMIIFIESLTLIYSFKVLIDWTYFIRHRRDNNTGKLIKMQHEGNVWVYRHMVCALLAIMMIVAIKVVPILHEDDHLTEAITAYAVISMLFVVSIIQGGREISVNSSVKGLTKN